MQLWFILGYLFDSCLLIHLPVSSITNTLFHQTFHRSTKPLPASIITASPLSPKNCEASLSIRSSVSKPTHARSSASPAITAITFHGTYN